MPRQWRNAVRLSGESRHPPVRGARRSACAAAPHLAPHPAPLSPRLTHPPLASCAVRSIAVTIALPAQSHGPQGHHRRHPPRRPRADDGAHWTVRARGCAPPLARSVSRHGARSPRTAASPLRAPSTRPRAASPRARSDARRRRLHRNQLTGPIPTEIGQMTAITDLCVRATALRRPRSVSRLGPSARAHLAPPRPHRAHRPLSPALRRTTRGAGP